MATPTTPSEHPSFFHALDQLVAAHEITIDRRRGTPHPRYPDAVYPLDYGYLEGTRSGDGGGIDVWVGSAPSSRRVTAAVVTVDLAKADSEVKVLLGCTPAEVELVLKWHNRGLQSGLLVERPATGEPETG